MNSTLALEPSMIRVTAKRNRAVYVAYILVLWIFAQDLITMLLGKWLTPSTFQTMGNAVLIGKEVFTLLSVLGLGLFCALPARHWNLADRLAIGMALLVGFYVVIPNSWLGGYDVVFAAKLIGARSILVPAELYFLGRWLPLSSEDLISLLRFILKVGLVSVLAGIALTTMLSGEEWQDLGLTHLYSLKAGFVMDNSGIFSTAGLPQGWYFQELPQSIVPWPGLRRFSSLIVEPISTGIVTAFLFVLSVAMARRRRLDLRTLLLGLGSIFALSRGGWMVAGLGYLFMRTKRPFFVTGMGIATIVIGLYAYGLAGTNFEITLSTSERSDAMADGIGQAFRYPQGRGLGTIGYFSGVITGENPLVQKESMNPFSVESFFGTLSAQLGLLGIVLWISFLVALIRSLSRIANKLLRVNEQLGQIALAICGSVIAIFVIGFVTSSGYGFVGLALPFMLAGLMVGVSGRVGPSYA